MGKDLAAEAQPASDALEAKLAAWKALAHAQSRLLIAYRLRSWRTGDAVDAARRAEDRLVQLGEQLP